MEYLPKFYDPTIKAIEALPVRTLEDQEALKNKTLDDYKTKDGSDPKKLKSATDYFLSVYQTDQQRRDDRLKIVMKQKEDALKNYTDELKATTEANLLSSPAIVPGGIFNIGNGPIFTTEANGNLLITENPTYFQKDLPKYIPQLFVLSFDKYDWSFTPKKEPITLMEENFPIEKLQAMIDK